VPVWSATTLEPVPATKKAYHELVIGQLTRPVYFRELIEKLYEQEEVRVFVQIGAGALTGFVEDTLKDREFCAISANLPARDGADQLRRVLAALFVEGRAVDAGFLGVKPMYRVDHGLMILPVGAPLMTELPELTEVVQNRYGASGIGGVYMPDSPDTFAHPIHQAAAENLREAAKVQGELIKLFSGQPSGQPSEKTFTEPIRISLEDHPYLLDHAIVRQPADWPFTENLNAVVPFTMTIELLADIAKRHAPGRKLIQIRRISAFQWVAVQDVFTGTVNGVWQDPDLLDLELMDYAKATFYFADSWPEPPAEYTGDIDIGERITEPISAEDLYDGYAFHGPQYKSATKTLKICERGIANLTEKKAGKGSLLDIMGQQLGLFLHLTQEENTISFPTRLAEINFYDDYTDQEGVFEHTLITTRLRDTSITGDMVLKRAGRVWSVAREFVCQRFENDRPLWYVSLKPQYHKLAREIAPDVYHYSGAKVRANVQAMLAKRYMDIVDGQKYLELKDGRAQRKVLTSRIALKDAVRSRIAKGDDEMAYPVEIFLHHDEHGRPFVRGHAGLGAQVDHLHVSLAHKEDEAVAIVSDGPVGIDIEKIEEKAESFLAAAFTDRERTLLTLRGDPEDVIRFWVAKEACGKKAGTGLAGNPRQYEVRTVEGDLLYIGKEKIQTLKVGEEHIAGWTI
jgi:phosphopantetheinyl transferase (holo-ACP synthase)